MPRVGLEQESGDSKLVQMLLLAPDGQLDARIKLPVPAPTMPCFGGPDLRTLFVTCLTPASGGTGAVLAASVTVPGTPVNRFAG